MYTTARLFSSAVLLLVLVAMERPTTAGQVLLTDLSPWTDSFDSYRGTAITVPPAWTTAGDLTFHSGNPNDGNAQNGVLTAGSSLYPAIGGWYALNSTDSPNDYAFGLRTQTTSTSSLTAEFVNTTGSDIGRLDFLWDFEQYTEGFGNGQVALLWSSDGTTFSSAGLSGDLAKGGVFGASPPVVYGSPSVSSQATSLTYDLQEGESVFVRFLWTSTKAGNQPHFGIDNFSMTPVAVPEPSTFVLAGSLGLCALIARLWRRGIA